MGKHDQLRGGTPVGMLSELPKFNALSVLMFRHWWAGPDGQAEVWSRFCTRYPFPAAHEHMKSFEQLMSLLSRHCRRPLMYHNVQCSCLGGDESAFASFIEAAALGDREDAMLFAINLMRPDMAVMAASLAEQVGLAISGINVEHPLGDMNISNQTKH